MVSKKRRWWIVGGAALGVALGVAALLYAALSYRPTFYRKVEPAGPRRQENAEQFVERTLQLRNDVVNEPRWEAVFTEDQINAWLAEELPREFPEMLPTGIEDPRIVLAAGRMTLAFTYTAGPMPGVVWAVFQVDSSGENEVTLRIEELRMGLLPVPESLLVDRLKTMRDDSSFALIWGREGGMTVAKLRYEPAAGRKRLMAIDEVLVAPGWIRIAGQTERVDEPRQAAGEIPSGDQRSF